MENKKTIFFNNGSSKEMQLLFPVKVLLENFSIKKTTKRENADIIMGPIERFHHKDYLDNNKTNIIVSGENIFFKRNLFSVLESILFRVVGNKKYKVLDFLDKIIPKIISGIPLSPFLKGYLKVLKKVKLGKLKNTYFILSNNLKEQNSSVLTMPLFMQYYEHLLKRLTNKRGKGIKEIKDKKFCAFVVSSNSSRERVHFFKELSKYKKVDSYGKVLNNCSDPKRKTLLDNPQIFKDYKFVICFENSFTKGYITEKLPNVMFANSIPIYRGAPNVGEYFNTKSFINYEDYEKSYDLMVQKIIELDKDPKKYKKIMEEPWFKENKIPKTITGKKKELIKFYNLILNEK